MKAATLKQINPNGLSFSANYDPVRSGDISLLICVADNHLFHFVWILSVMLSLCCGPGSSVMDGGIRVRRSPGGIATTPRLKSEKY